jgi:uncharacterized protein YjiS (DUF1127 family)
MQMDIPFTESRPLRARPLRARGVRPARRRQSVLSTLIRQISDWTSAWLAAHRGIAELQAMDDRMLRDIGLRREEVEGIPRYGRLPGT